MWLGEILCYVHGVNDCDIRDLNWWPCQSVSEVFQSLDPGLRVSPLAGFKVAAAGD